MTEKTKKLKSILNNARRTTKNINEYSFEQTPFLEFELIDVNQDDENSILFDNINELIMVLKESGINQTEKVIRDIIKTKIGIVSSEFRLRFF
jgi:hypothetical protein